MKGRRIRTLEAIVKLADAGRSVWVERWRRRCPAAFLVSMQARALWLFIQSGMWEWKPKAVRPRGGRIVDADYFEGGNS